MKRLDHWFAAMAAVVLAGAGSTVVAAPAYAAPCADVNVVFARGTFEPPGLGAVGDAFANSLRAKSGKSVDVYGVNYPASLDFGAAADGVADASAKVRDIAATCPNSKIVLGGYSQGAAVAAYITQDTLPQGFALPPQIQGPMPAEIANHVAAVALFGKPTSGFMQLIYSGAPPITVGSRYTGKTVEECIPTDPICSPSGGDNGAHGQYVVSGLTDQAADYVVGKLPRGGSRSVEQASAHG
jgi:cutinase